MLEFSSPLRSSGFLRSNYTEVLPDASRHCRTEKPRICTKSVWLPELGKGNAFEIFSMPMQF